ncbi:hypothetical protein [Mucilaginibacter kameinonensis]|uniref:hypothetical protein n=1 Tax=Mucilaginibacter kameinonensis TaxID=452286 RepID=UPI000EF7C5C7|nr:hypothetical protein [Mucilaginibacter kameinonensis]
MNTESLVISLIVNVVGVGAFVIDRIYRINYIKEYKEAKEAQITMLKEQVEFLSKHDDNYLSNKMKERFETMKLLLNENDTKSGREVGLMVGRLEETVNFLTDENSKLKEEKGAFKEALTITLELFDFMSKRVELNKVDYQPTAEEQNLYFKKISRVEELMKKYDFDEE